MKKLLVQAVLVALVGVFAVSANAGWKCRMHNDKGQKWYGTGPTRAAASANAMSFCSKNSAYAKNCTVDWCRSGY